MILHARHHPIAPRRRRSHHDRTPNETLPFPTTRSCRKELAARRLKCTPGRAPESSGRRIRNSWRDLGRPRAHGPRMACSQCPISRRHLAEQDRLRRQELRRTRHRNGRHPPKGACNFLKPPSCMIAPEEPIVMPRISERVDYEGEIAIIIGRRCRIRAPRRYQSRHRRLHVPQRCHRARPPEARRAIDPWQGLRHLLPVRPGRRDRAALPGYHCRDFRQRGEETIRAHLGNDFSHRCYIPLDRAGDDAGARRRDRDGHPRGRRPLGGGRRSRGPRGRHRRAS